MEFSEARHPRCWAGPGSWHEACSIHVSVHAFDTRSSCAAVRPRASLPPGPPLVAIPATLRGLHRDPLDYLSSLVHRYGNVVRLRFLVLDALVVFEPDHVKHVLQDRHAIYTMADHRLMELPILGRAARRIGAVDGTRPSCIRLLRAGAAVLTFPEGARALTVRSGTATSSVPSGAASRMSRSPPASRSCPSPSSVRKRRRL